MRQRLKLSAALASLLICTSLATPAAPSKTETTMRQYRLEKADKGYRLVQQQAAVPKPGTREVLVHVRATALNRRDLYVLAGQYGPGDLTGKVPLSDGAGEVAAIGAQVSRVKVGDRVAAIFFQRWLAGKPDAASVGSALGGAIDGMLSEYVVLNEDGLVRIPDHLSFEEAATLPCAGVTAWNGLFTRGNLQPGDYVLLEGTGGVSIFGLQFAVAAGAKPIITSSSDAKLEHAKKLGAWQTINYKSTADWDQAVMKLTEGHGADQVLEVGGEQTIPKALGSTASGGHIALIGGLSGWNGQLPAGLLAIRSIRTSGIYVGSRADFEAMNAFIAEHQLKPVIDKEFKFADAPAAFAYMDSATLFGKVVIRMP
ncbi:MAG TPA: NAD(P)-dependent alcohol dehydrogenase [Steroidobacteraceae bacterium]|nr:NAD(P)-dependent alcohol dehydrogenase [Steroidobacteraceae bacterium]